MAICQSVTWLSKLGVGYVSKTRGILKPYSYQTSTRHTLHVNARRFCMFCFAIKRFTKNHPDTEKETKDKRENLKSQHNLKELLIDTILTNGRF